MITTHGARRTKQVYVPQPKRAFNSSSSALLKKRRVMTLDTRNEEKRKEDAASLTKNVLPGAYHQKGKSSLRNACEAPLSRGESEFADGLANVVAVLATDVSWKEQVSDQQRMHR
jgi:hypothetical protein